MNCQIYFSPTIKLLMQAYQSDNKQKGLFTFYREQAEIEQTLKLQRKYIKLKQNEISEIKQPKIERKHAAPSKVNSNHNQNSILQQSSKPKDPQNSHGSQKSSGQYQKKLIEILQKHKYQGNRRRNFRVILKPDEQDEISLRYHLEALQQEQNQINQQNNKEKSKRQTKNQIFAQKKNQIIKSNPFKKIALCPTNFQSELQELSQIQKLKKYSYPTKPMPSLCTSLDTKKILKNLEETQTPEFKNKSQLLYKQLFPKIDLRSNSELTKQKGGLFVKEKDQSYTSRNTRITQESSIKINNGRLKQKQKSFCIQNSRYEVQNTKIKNSIQNRIYPIFIQNRDSKRYDQQAQTDKQKLFVEVIRKLKFT